VKIREIVIAEAENTFYEEVLRVYAYEVVFLDEEYTGWEPIISQLPIWAAENDIDCLAFPTSAIGGYKARVRSAFFKKQSDALLAKLTWGGQSICSEK
jgi:hypothetical protein